MSEQSTAAPFLSPSDVAVINASRVILKQLAGNVYKAGRDTDRRLIDAVDFGMVAAQATAAEDAIFSCLNTLTSHGVQPLTSEQLHNRQGEEA
jgi:S-adenosylmethionine:tRNA-ribosyltransferase-isomerase (queuine synthetase)